MTSWVGARPRDSTGAECLARLRVLRDPGYSEIHCGCPIKTPPFEKVERRGGPEAPCGQLRSLTRVCPRRIESVRLTIRAGQVCELGDFSTRRIKPKSRLCALCV